MVAWAKAQRGGLCGGQSDLESAEAAVKERMLSEALWPLVEYALVMAI